MADVHSSRRITEVLLDLLYVPRCASCGERLPHSQPPLCPACLRSYRDACSRICYRCGEVYARCTCTTEELLGMRVRRLAKLFPYEEANFDAPQNRLLYALKREHPAALARFLAGELAPSLRSVAVQGEEWILVNVPRARTSVRRYGYDQTAYLCRALARVLDIPFHPLLRSGKSLSEQKHLTAQERRKNVKGQYAVKEGAELHGMRVLLVDDVTTTGATLGECARQLRRAGAREVVGVVLAVTVK